MTERTATRTRMDLQARYGLIDGEECELRGVGEGDAPRRCRVFIYGRPRLRWWIVNLERPGGPDIAATRRILTGSERDRLVPV